MSRVINAAADLGAEGWRKPWSGSNGGQCLEAKVLGDGRVALRQSTDPDGPAVIYTSRDITDFVNGAKAGAADFLLTPDPSTVGPVLDSHAHAPAYTHAANGGRK